MAGQDIISSSLERLPKDLTRELLDRITPDDMLIMIQTSRYWTHTILGFYGEGWYNEATLNKVTKDSPNVIGLPLSIYRAAFYGYVRLLRLFISRVTVEPLSIIMAGAAESGYIDIVISVIEQLSQSSGSFDGTTVAMNSMTIGYVSPVFMAAGRGGYSAVIDVMRNRIPNTNVVDILVGALQAPVTKANNILITQLATEATINPFEDYGEPERFTGKILPYATGSVSYLIIPTATSLLLRNLLLLLSVRPDWELSLIAPRIDAGDIVTIEYMESKSHLSTLYRNAIAMAAARVGDLSLFVHILGDRSIELSPFMHPDIILYLLNRGVQVSQPFGNFLDISPEIDTAVAVWVRTSLNWGEGRCPSVKEALFILNTLRYDKVRLNGTYVQLLRRFIVSEQYQIAKQLLVSGVGEMTKEVVSEILQWRSFDLMNTLISVSEEAKRGSLLATMLQLDTTKDSALLCGIIRANPGLDLTELVRVMLLDSVSNIDLFRFLLSEEYIKKLPLNDIINKVHPCLVLLCLEYKLINIEQAGNAILRAMVPTKIPCIINNLPPKLSRYLNSLSVVNNPIDPMHIKGDDATSIFTPSVVNNVGIIRVPRTTGPRTTGARRAPSNTSIIGQLQQTEIRINPTQRPTVVLRSPRRQLNISHPGTNLVVTVRPPGSLTTSPVIPLPTVNTTTQSPTVQDTGTNSPRVNSPRTNSTTPTLLSLLMQSSPRKKEH